MKSKVMLFAANVLVVIGAICAILLAAFGGLIFAVNVIGFIIEGDWYITAPHFLRFLVCLSVPIAMVVIAMGLFYIQEGTLKKAIKKALN